MKRATKSDYDMYQQSNISIHALMKRATCGLRLSPFGAYISIHALMKRATYIIL